MKRISAAIGCAFMIGGTAATFGSVRTVSATFTGYCMYRVYADPPTQMMGPYAKNWPIRYSGGGRCDYAAGGSVQTCLQRSSWSGWREVGCKTGYIDFAHPEVRNTGVGSCLHGTYTYRVWSSISISTPNGDAGDFALSPERRWTCP
jgi:hypothetical protein